jgi:hypothetical protein
LLVSVIAARKLISMKSSSAFVAAAVAALIDDDAIDGTPDVKVGGTFATAVEGEFVVLVTALVAPCISVRVVTVAAGCAKAVPDAKLVAGLSLEAATAADWISSERALHQEAATARKQFLTPTSISTF